MASWEDGPEYAPVARPDHFDLPPVAPLQPAPAADSVPSAPIERPQFAGPSDPVPLAALEPPPEESRDPQVPFDVVASTATADTSAWSAAHWSAPTAAGPPGAGTLGRGGPSGQPWLPATQPWLAPPPAPGPLVPQTGPPPAYGPYAAPGTVGWFAPPPAGYPPPPPARLGAKEVLQAATPGLLICLLIGGLIYPLAPITMCIAFGLSSRVQAAREWVRRTLAGVLGLLGLVGLIGLVVGDRTFNEWWLLLARWAQALTWALVIVVPLLVYSALKRPPTGVGPRRGPWS